MIFDYSDLLSLMKKKGKRQEDIAKDIGLQLSTLNQKLNNKAKFKQSEIIRICDTLDIKPVDIGSYFFTLRV